MDRVLRVALLEPYYGGSHKAFIDAFARFTRHRSTLATLPARKWKWRMRGAALWFARDDQSWLRSDDGGPIDVILCNDMLSVADLRALLQPPIRHVPIACYFHENQLTYPIPPGQERDYQYGMTNITSCLASDAVWFNSRFHLEDFLTAAGRLLRKMPDFLPRNVVDEIRGKAEIFAPPVVFETVDRVARAANEPATILWCHRWEYDKNPEPFFDALVRLAEVGVDFRLLMLGEQFRTAPPAFDAARRRLGDRITHAGYLPDRSEYQSMLSRCHLVVSTAIQENFGIAVVEAILAGCQPLLPRRLAYPQVIPDDFHKDCLYDRDSDLFDRLRSAIDGTGGMSVNRLRDLQAALAARYGAQTAVSRLDDALERLRWPG